MSVYADTLEAILRLENELSEELRKAARDLRRVADVDGGR